MSINLENSEGWTDDNEKHHHNVWIKECFMERGTSSDDSMMRRKCGSIEAPITFSSDMLPSSGMSPSPREDSNMSLSASSADKDRRSDRSRVAV